jgi:lactobin A/cerein 7B family class IIb bacteriocin
MMMSRYIDQSARALNNDELDDNELDSVTGGLVVIAIIAVLMKNISLVGPATTNGSRGTGGQIGP